MACAVEPPAPASDDQQERTLAVLLLDGTSTLRHCELDSSQSERVRFAQGDSAGRGGSDCLPLPGARHGRKEATEGLSAAWDFFAPAS